MSIERRIIIGLIASTDFLKQNRPLIDANLFKSAVAKLLARWCLEYYDEYKTAPGKQIESIYLEKLKNKKVSEDLAEEIEEDILPGLNEEYKENPDLKYLKDQTTKYFKERKIQVITEQIQVLLENGDVEAAEELIKEYKTITGQRFDISLADESILPKIDQAFKEVSAPVLEYPGALGQFWNHQLVKGGLVGLMAPEKRGKTFLLLDMSIRACRQGKKVAFFQAGDMTENQQLMRTCIYLAKKSNLEKYTGIQYLPVKDCIFNQLDICDKDERECDHGSLVDSDYTKETLRNEITFFDLVETFKEKEDYVPCYNCKEYGYKKWGTPWLKQIRIKNVLGPVEAKEKINNFFIKTKRQFKLSSHANGTLSIEQINSILDTWEIEDGFSPDLIVIDYADLLVCEKRTEFRHQQNEIWKGLRGISQSRNQPLVVAPTQTDAKSYEVDTISLKHFSEDKRKYAHVTAMYGMNQDKTGREKRIGILRLNELVVREGDFDVANQVRILQRLEIGRPFLTSYF